MAGDDAKLLRQLYAGPLQRDPEERAEYLVEACGRRSDLRARVVALLEAHSQDFLDAPSLRHVEPAITQAGIRPNENDVDGRRVGDYVLRREIGRGWKVCFRPTFASDCGLFSKVVPHADP